MIGYTTIGTNNIFRAATFYDELLGSMGAVRTMEAEDFIVWGKTPKTPMFSIHIPVNGEIATVGNGCMTALVAKDREQVAAVYYKAIELGAKNEGLPGPRGDTGFYAAYFRDIDGNKLNIHHIP